LRAQRAILAIFPSSAADFRPTIKAAICSFFAEFTLYIGRHHLDTQNSLDTHIRKTDKTFIVLGLTQELGLLASWLLLGLGWGGVHRCFGALPCRQLSSRRYGRSLLLPRCYLLKLNGLWQAHHRIDIQLDYLLLQNVRALACLERDSSGKLA